MGPLVNNEGLYQQSDGAELHLQAANDTKQTLNKRFDTCVPLSGQLASVPKYLLPLVKARFADEALFRCTCSLYIIDSWCHSSLLDQTGDFSYRFSHLEAGEFERDGSYRENMPSACYKGYDFRQNCFSIGIALGLWQSGLPGPQAMLTGTTA